MSQEQLAELEAEKAKMTPEELASERMMLNYQVRFWRQKAWRAEQQRDREIAERKALELRFKKYSEIPQKILDDAIRTAETQELVYLKDRAVQALPFLLWSNKCREENEIEAVGDKIKFWSNLLSSTDNLDE
jgi:hypothetical protein